MFDIAIIEDEELERRALRSILEKNLDSCRIVGEARNGTEAMALIDSQHIDLMLVDIKIPRPTGLEVIQSVRDRGLATKVMILTAYDYFELMQSAIHLKADNFLLKPIRTADLLKAVRECLPEHEPVAARAADAWTVTAPAPAPDSIRAPEPPVADRIAELVDQSAYRECLALVRRHLETIYAQREAAPRRAVMEFMRIMLQMVERRGLALPATLARHVEALETQRLDLHSHFQVQEILCQITDVLFEANESGGAHASDRIQDVLNYIERNLHKGVTLEDAADFAQISPCYLSRLFRKEMDVTFISYLKAQRIERAKQLLQDSDLPITNVSLDLSFQDANYFGKAFKKEVGLSPSEYRRRFR
ncbi:response regulator [Rhodovulum sulfidophilum]|uniref:Response regulator n=1 Tax=Rhodovulum sulfidophilum TaxID=35806 RepID=A0ABS1RWF7_RHOSU|nr:response regulator [Rhodovulum sulfidophilum]MBL3564087.1 response regulator [Rhodovulum sulfidophilum]MBL3596870.1 response regulator [Rhodovulum sulfidophilum]MBL3609294.1 response regulator [Rhodovulum sulfidophilum]MCE8419021.1 response regulator [Rhodovulum sulfidophilum]MCE8438740.1 response regulator [Rhodovulum sulfidophilum]